MGKRDLKITISSEIAYIRLARELTAIVAEFCDEDDFNDLQGAIYQCLRDRIELEDTVLEIREKGQ